MKKVINRILQKSPSLLDSKFVFYIPLFFSAILVLLIPIYPSVDGAAHLYNSAILKDLLLNSTSPYHDFYQFNTVIVPNWLDHILLALLMCVFSALWAQKIFVIALILSQAIVFRLIIIKLNPENKLLSCFILPFIFSSFFYIGLYNQLLSFTLLYCFIYWLLSAKTEGYLYYLGLFCFSIFLWFSSIVMYAVFLILLAIYTIYQLNEDRLKYVAWFKKIGFMILVFLPTLFLSLNFIAKISMLTDEKPINYLNKLILFFRLEPLTVFDLTGESKLTIPLVVLLFILFFIGYKSISNTVKKSILLTSIFIGLLFFIIPNNAGAGMLSFRLAMSFYLLLIVLVASFNYHKTVILISSLAVLSIHLGLVMKRHNGRLRSYTQASVNYVEVGKHIPIGATVWPISNEEDWFLGHSNNYLGIANSCIILENYETYYPWFPLLFKPNKTNANTLYNELRSKKQLNSFSDVSADYLVVYQKNTNALAEGNYLIKKNHSFVFQTADSTMKLYKLNAN